VDHWERMEVDTGGGCAAVARVSASIEGSACKGSRSLTHSLTYVASSRGSGATRRLANIIMLIDPRVGMVGS